LPHLEGGAGEAFDTRMPRVQLSSLALLATVACGGPESASTPEPAAHSADELVGGTLTKVRPEIGFVSLEGHGACTATLIAADVLLTAAHCVDYTSQDTEGVYGFAGLDTTEGRKEYGIDRFVSLGSALGARDLALVHLRSPVPASLATPTTVASAVPARSAEVTIYGYGCLERATQEGSFEKRSASATYATSQRLCPGDSGGPVTLGPDGPIVAINSGYYVQRGDDIFADPVTHAAAITAQLAAWGPAPTSEVITLTNSTGGALWARCDGGEGPGCSGWVYIAAGGRGTVETFRRRLVLDNQGRVPGFVLDARRVTAPSTDVIVKADEADPLGAGTAAPPPACLGGESSARATPAPFDGDGQVCAGRESWWSVTLAEGQALSVDVSFAHAAGDIDVAVLDPSGNVVAKSDTTTDVESVRHTAATAGAYSVRVYGYQGAGNAVHVRIH
jgi:hypothetical protein